jgi:uncharacterized RDD family membrane protein YckC
LEQRRTVETPPSGGLAYAGSLPRLTAWLVDFLITLIASALVADVLIRGGSGLRSLGAFVAINLAVNAAYLIGLWQTGQTLGMRLFRLTVVRSEDGGRLGPRRAARRFVPFGLAVIFLPVVLPFVVIVGALGLSISMDDRSQGLHDRLAGSVVLQRRR